MKTKEKKKSPSVPSHHLAFAVSDWFREYFVPLVDEMRPRVSDRDEEEIAAKDFLRLFLLTGGRPREK